MRKYQFQGKALVGYLFPGVLCMLFALFIDARFGFTFLIIYLLLPVVSLMLAKLAADRTQLSVSCPDTVLGKGDTIKLRVDVECPLQVCFAYCNITLLHENRLDMPENQVYSQILGRRHNQMLDVAYPVLFCGPARCGVQQVVVTDFLGFCKFPVRIDTEAVTTVSILPDIKEISDNPLLRSALENGLVEEEEETPQNLITTGGVPGYEHRAYVPGDPLKRINWKLSAKRDQFMVRQLEAVSATKVAILIDAYSAEPPILQTQLMRAQILVESALAMARLLTIQGLECEISYWKQSEGWSQNTLQEEKDVGRVQFGLSEFEFTNEEPQEGRYPDSLLTREGSVMVFTFRPDPVLMAQADGSIEYIVPQGGSAPVFQAWVVDGDMTFAKQL